MKTVAKALDLLMLFTERDPEWSVTELARASGQHKTGVSRILSTLSDYRIVTKDPKTNLYRLGSTIIRLSHIALGDTELRHIAYPLMQSLAETTGESVFLTVVAHTEALCIEKVDGPQHVRVSFEVGRQTPLHAGASAKLLLAFLPEHQIELILTSRLGRYTRATVTDIEQLQKQLEKIRKQNHAISSGELDDSVCAIAVPITDKGGVIASLSIAGPISRITQSRTRWFLHHLHQTANRMSANLSLVSERPQTTRV